MQRCGWVTQDPLYLAYHDREWGSCGKGRQKLFEMICLEGQQAGLSWITVLKKRENYRNAFHQFDPERVAAMTTEDVETLLQNAGIIRHRGKIEAIIGNARAYLSMAQNGESFSDFVWGFVDHTPQITNAAALSEIPTSTPASDALSKALKNAASNSSAPPSVTRLCKPAALRLTIILPAVSATPGDSMIRAWRNKDLSPLLNLWLESTIYAHPFIEVRYWHERSAGARRLPSVGENPRVWERTGHWKGLSALWMRSLLARCSYAQPQ